MRYKRVIPRDFFNEAKLLKCLGQLQLLIHDNRVNGLPLKVEFDHEPFNIVQDQSDGRLFVTNYHVFLDNNEIYLSTAYNSKDKYPLMGEYKGEEYYMLDGRGQLLPNFDHVIRSNP